MLRACLFLLAGMYVPQLSSFAIAPGQAVVIVALVCLLRPLGKLRAVAWLFVGMALFGAAVDEVVAGRLDPDLAGDSIVVTVRVLDFPRRRGTALSFPAATLDDERLPQRVRISWHQPPVNIHPGDLWRLELRLRRPRAPSNPGAFDAEAWLLREHIGAVGYVVGSRRNHLLRGAPVQGIGALRRRFVARIDALVDDPGAAGILNAVVVGARHGISTEWWDRFGRTGTSHLVAISGLHIGLAAIGGYGLALAFLGGVRVGGNVHVVATGAGLLLAVAYTLLSGLAVPSRRAAAMLAVAAVALLRRRRPEPLRALAAAGLAVAVTDPLATMAPGFRLSFAAVALLLWLARQYTARGSTSRARRAVQFLPALALLQVHLLCGLLPLVTPVFGRVSLAAPAANLVVVPLFSLVTVPLALMGLCLDGPLAGLGNACLLAAATSAGWMLSVIAALADWPGAAQTVPAPVGMAWLFLLLPAVWAMLPPGWPGRSTAWLGLAVLLLYQPGRGRPGCADVHVLDVGQGLAVVVETSTHTLLFDTGPAWHNGGNAAESVLLPFLAARGTRRVDRLLVSHADLDHAGGVATVLAGVAVGEVRAGEPLAGIPTSPCRNGQWWTWDEVHFRVLHPPAGKGLAGNDASCVLLVEAGHRVLLTGDIEATAEAGVLARGLAPVDVVLVPHHGSTTSSTPAFVAATRPALAVASAGFANRWSQPRPEIVERWRESGARVLTTADSGAVSLRLCGDAASVSVRQHRRDRRRIWLE